MVPNIHKHDEIVRVLRRIRDAGFESAVIAGGAVRDLYFDVTPTDIDIFIWDPLYSNEDVGDFSTITHPDKGIESVSRLMKLKHSNDFGFFYDEAKRSWAGYQGGCPKINAIWNVSKDFLPYQLIFLKEKPIVHINNNFDFGICKCYCDGTKFRFTSDFMHDARHQHLTLVAINMSGGEFNWAMEKHLPKIQAKYPRFIFKTAPWNERLVAKYKKK